MQPSLNQIRLLANDFSACFRFYRDVMELPVGFGNEDDVYADFTLGGGQSLGLFRRGLMAEVVGTQALPVHTAAQDSIALVFQVDHVDDAVQQLTAKGVTLAAPPTDRAEWGMRTAQFRDPDGNLLEIFHPMPMSEEA